MGSNAVMGPPMATNHYRSTGGFPTSMVKMWVERTKQPSISGCGWLNSLKRSKTTLSATKFER